VACSRVKFTFNFYRSFYANDFRKAKQSTLVNTTRQFISDRPILSQTYDKRSLYVDEFTTVNLR